MSKPGVSQTTDETVWRWLADAEAHRRAAEVSISESARLDHIANASRLKQMAYERMRALKETP